MASIASFAIRHRTVHGVDMAYLDEGQGPTILFQHGQPTSSHVWRNVLPHLAGKGRLIATDLVGMGHSGKLPDSGPGSYSLREHATYLFALWDALDLGNDVILVLDDWGAALGFQWARENPGRVAGIVHMEAVAVPMSLSDLPEPAHPFFAALRSPAGEKMVLEDNVFIERVLPGAMLTVPDAAAMEEYRRPFLEPGEGRRATLSFPRNLPLDGEPADTVATIAANAAWLAASDDLPKLFVHGEPGVLMRGRVREAVRAWPNQQVVTVAGNKILQEGAADAIGGAIASFVDRVRG